jgi:hypothetical protein
MSLSFSYRQANALSVAGTVFKIAFLRFSKNEEAS